MDVMMHGHVDVYMHGCINVWVHASDNKPHWDNPASNTDQSDAHKPHAGPTTCSPLPISLNTQQRCYKIAHKKAKLMPNN